MFIKKTKGGSKKNPIVYYQLVHSERDKKGIPRHKVVMNIGREDEIKDNPQIIDSIIKALTRLSSSLVVVDKDEEFLTGSYIYGPLLLIDKIWEDVLSMPSIIREEIIDKKGIRVKFDIEKAIRLMVINRLISPMSKLAITRWKRYLWDSDNTYTKIKLQHLYRSLDILSSSKDEIEERLYEKTLSLFYPESKHTPGKAKKAENGKESKEENRKRDKKIKEVKNEIEDKKENKIDNVTENKAIDIVFYDLTTTYFESVTEDSIKRFGYSKDNKTDCVQIVIALIITPDGIPIGYDIFPGNTYEGHTIGDMLEKLKKRFKLKKVIVVGDKGILSNKVLDEIEGYGYEYIVSAKLKSLPKRYHKEILNLENYHPVFPVFPESPEFSVSHLSSTQDTTLTQKDTKDTLNTKNTQDTRSLKPLLLTHEISIGKKGRRLILGYSEKRRRRDEIQRNALLEKIADTLSKHPGETFIKPAYKRYLNIKKEGNTSIDEEKIEKQKIWDGFFGFYTNNDKLSAREVVSIYRMLWKIEDRFRTLKSQLHLRPIYHFTENRIEGHILVCFLSLYISTLIEKKIEYSYNSSIRDEIRDDITKIMYKTTYEKTDKPGEYEKTRKEEEKEYEKEYEYEDEIEEYEEPSITTSSWIMNKLKEVSVIKINTLSGIVYSRMSMDTIHKKILKLFSIKIPPTILKEIKEDDTKKRTRSKIKIKPRTKAKDKTRTKNKTKTKTKTETKNKQDKNKG